MPKRSGDRIDDYSDEYFQNSLQYIEDYVFVNKVFESSPGLVTMNESSTETKPYAGEEYDESIQKVVPDAWDHEHCYVCGWRIDDGYSYWQNAGGLVLCDECHHYVSTDERQGKR
jgi:hypothetical protein